MRTTLLIIVAGIIALALTSCEDYTGPSRWNEAPYYVITGNLHQGEPITLDTAIFVGRTVSANGGNLQDMLVLDAQVIVRDLTDHSVDSLVFDYEETDDDVKIGYIDPDQSFIPQVRHRYRIVALIPGEADSVWAETVVPDPITLLPDDAFATNPDAEYPLLKWETANVEHPLRVQTVGDSVSYMYFKFYCLEEYSKNLEYTISYMGDHPESEDDYEDPTYGWPRKIEYFWRYQPQLDENDGNYYILDRGYKANIWFYGRYSVTIYHIDENYYNYLYKPEGYRFGGVQNGVGWFGSVCGGTMYTHVVK